MLLKSRLRKKKSRRHHGKNSKATAGSNAATGRTSSRMTGSSARSTITSSGRLHSARRLGPQQRHQQQRSHQQQVQQGQQQTITSLSSLNGVTVRNSDESCTTRASSSSTQDICDNSNDSGLGFEERQQQQAQQQLNNSSAWNGAGEEDTKRRKMDIKLESEDANFAFPEEGRGASVSSSSSSTSSNGSISSNSSKRNNNSNAGEANKATGVARSCSSGGNATANGIGPSAISSSRTGNGNGTVGRVVGVTRPRPGIGIYTKRPSPAHQGPVTLTSQLCSASRDGKTQLQIICQPEQQHRARYQTEGSRGAVKDRTGNGFPIVRLVGYDKPATLQVFIGTDLGRVAPHMFYQACRVSGKNSTPCVERKLDGTIVIEVDMDPTKDMIVTCDCVGILKERNVDVEHRFPQEAGVLQGRSKKKSTRCRMVFRTNITHADGTNETLQVCSQPIVCTQPPGIPEICKKSLTSSPCTGGLELFILGKNFLKDTRVVFQLDKEDLSSSLEPHWECAVTPDKEFLQQTHLVCVVPPYRRQDLALTETVSVKLYAVSSGKTSEPHTFLYTAASTPPEPSIGKVESTTLPLPTVNNDTVSLSTTPAAVPLAGVANNALIPQVAATSPNFLASIQQQTQPSAQSQQLQSEVLKNDPSPPPSSATGQVTPVMMWAAQASNCQNSVPDVMMPPPNLVANPLLNRRSSSNHQLIIPDNLKTEVLDDSSENSMLSDDGMQSISTPTSNGGSATSSLQHQLVSENSLEASQSSMIRSVSVASLSSPAQEAVGILGVVDLMRNPHPLALASSHQSAYAAMHEQTHVKVLSPRHINKDVNNVIMPNEVTTNGTALQGADVVDLRMKHHQSEYNTLSNFTTTPAGQPLPAQSGQSIEKYLNHIESTAVPKESENSDNNFVGGIQQRASIIANGRPQASQQTPDILAPNAATVKLDALVNSAVDSHQMVSPMRSVNTSPNGMIGQLSDHESITSPQQATRTSPPIPVKTMLLEALMPSPTGQALTGNTTTSVVNGATVVPETSPEDSLLTSINAALLPPMQEAPVVTAATLSNSTVSVTTHNPLQVSSEPIARSAEHIQQIQALTEQDVAIQQQVQQVEQVVAQAQQQVEQVVAQAQQQAVQAVQQAQQQVVHQVVQHAQVVQQAVQQVQAAQQVQAVPEVQQAVQQATQEVVQQAVQQATQEVVQQVQAVQQAVQQAQAAQAMQHAVQQDIGSMLNQPAGFVAEASSVLASGAAQEPCQQRLTNAAEQAINSVITNATQDIINNRPINTTTAHAIIATKNILNSVATQSAQLMNSAMEGILPKSPTAGQGTIAEQVSRKSPSLPMPVTSNRQNPNNAIQNTAATTNGQVIRKPDDDGGILTQELTSMSEHDLLSYINPSCFDPQGGFLM